MGLPANGILRHWAVTVLRGYITFGAREVLVADGSDQTPMVAHRAALESEPAEADCLERQARDPDRREEVALAAPHDNISTEVVAAPPPDNRATDDGRHDEENREHGDQPRRRHLPIITSRSAA